MSDRSSSPDPNTMTLVVKTPRQEDGDEIIEGVELNWKVLDLKKHLSRVYPSCPAEKDQRLIYSGKMLPDNLPIRDAFRKGDHMPIVHLVCAFRPQPETQQGARPKVRAEESSPPSSEEARQPAEVSTPPPSAHAPQMPSTGGLRHRGHPTPTSTPVATAGAATMAHPDFPTYSLYSPQQLLWLQHMYARQYYMHYQAAMAAASSTSLASTVGTTLPVAPHQAAVPAGLPNQAPIDNLPANQNAADPAFINPEGANQNLRMNAQGGPVMEDEEEMNRDWLDWLYTAARLGVFLSIVYFYSSLSRFILVMSSLLLMYLHTAGWFPFRRRPVARAVNEPAPEVIQNLNNLNNQNQHNEPAEPPAEGEGPEAAAEPEGQAPHPLTPVLVPPHRVSIVWTTWIFFKTFFASLIPEAPQMGAN
ncbi:homocysteine-responsive endoplasmic reticulum-resident ubiquitin-like domain member 1 protein [Clupea harengus]|uniref:Homocysteine-responsive endoplasmic reticulum-resident ubiquitin-like domain member 1 protein n=1 Tax=Clupea harengus TaxID=7950 RepID=A0A6P3VKL2_CLUHA|nr:homocysteine-responsive endoplasmic reticulum-resident ubiquitin-like domain member 1 protein [Clupea harengus]